MTIYNVITLVGGLAFFLYGMNVMSDGLEKSSNGKIDKYLKSVTKNRFFALMFGAILTIAVQSSSAVTVMLVGLVNSGIMQFGQTIGVLMGSNIGTTLTAWILSLAGIESEGIILNLLKPKNFAPIFALVGIIMIMVSKKQKVRSAGSVLIGFAVLMTGMTFMSDAMEPLADMPEFASILTAFTNPILSVLVGAAFTGIIQSSAASVAILQALSITGGITYEMAIPIIMGQNIGTCVTAVLSSIGVSRNAKKVAVVHLSFNIIGTVIGLIFFAVANYGFHLPFFETTISPFMIAIVHSIFNVVTTFILVPFTKQLEKLANIIIPDVKTDEDEQMVILDERLLTVPALAIKESFDVIVNMAHVSKKAFIKATEMLNSYTEEKAEKVSSLEDKLDKYEDQLGTYMMKVSKVGISEEDSKTVAKILHTIDDFERIGDHAMNIVEVAKELYDKQQAFSDDANDNIATLNEAVNELVDMTITAFETNDLHLAAKVEPLEQVVDLIILKIKKKHIKRLQDGDCTIQLGFALSDLLTSYERVADHCSNIGVAIIESHHGTFDVHEYLDSLKAAHDEDFERRYDKYLNKFSL